MSSATYDIWKMSINDYDFWTQTNDISSRYTENILVFLDPREKTKFESRITAFANTLLTARYIASALYCTWRRPVTVGGFFFLLGFITRKTAVLGFYFWLGYIILELMVLGTVTAEE